MAHGITLALREIPGPSRDIIPGTECEPIFRKIRGVDVCVGSQGCDPYVVPSRDRSLRGKARVRARRAARKAAA